MRPADVELFALHLLGALDGEEAMGVARRLANPTADDAAALAEARRVVAGLAHAAPVATPPEGARARLLARASAEPRTGSVPAPGATRGGGTPPSASGSRTAPPAAPRPARWFVPSALAALFLLMAGAQVYLNLQPPRSPQSEEQAQVLALLTDPTTERLTLNDTSDPKKPVALALQDAGRRRLLVFAKKLPTLDKGQTYVFWYLRPGSGGPTPENAGAFQVRAGALPDLVLADATALRDLAGVAVSVETDPRTKTPTSVRAAGLVGP